MAKILIVDDSSSIRNGLKIALQFNPEYEIIEAADGLEGLERIREIKDLKMCILDVNMPNMDGLTMLETLKQEYNEIPLPIVILTTEGEEKKVKLAKELGAVAWMLKPFKGPNLLKVVKKLTGT